MSPDLYFLLALAAKMATAAVFVIAATVTAERAGPAIGALIATLPVSAGPSYIFLALDHDASFIAESALASFAMNPATVIYATAYVVLSQRFGFSVSVPLAFLCWLVTAIVFVIVSTNAAIAILLHLLVFPACLYVVREFRDVRVPPAPMRWTDFAMRALLVACLVGAVVSLSFAIGPRATGVLAAFPVVFTSIMFILHWRIGSRAAAAVLANGVAGLAGFGLAVLTLYACAEPLGVPAALALALAVSIAWNLGLFFAGRRKTAVAVS